jgi:hypothetical protein
MKRYRLLAIGLTVAALIFLGAVVVALLLLARAEINASNAVKIQAGMTRAEVEEILGPPRVDPASSMVDEHGHAQQQWAGRDYTIIVSFDESGRVFDVIGFSDDPPMFTKLLRWLGL